MKNRKDISGQRFHKLIAIRCVGVSSRRKALWLCKCDCGNEVVRQGSGLREGKKSSCGCDLYGPKVDPKQQGINSVGHTYKYHAKRRGLKFDLSVEEFTKLLAGNCYYCGMEPSTLLKKGYAELCYNGIDRLNNNQGYVVENCVSCCQDCNYFKHKRDFYEFKEKIKTIYENICEKNP